MFVWAAAEMLERRKRGASSLYHCMPPFHGSGKMMYGLNMLQQCYLRCGRCSGNLVSQADSHVSKDTCWRCGYLVCSSCRDCSSQFQHLWTCCICAKQLSFAWLFGKTAHGLDLLLSVAEYVEPDTLHVLSDVFGSAKVRNLLYHKATVVESSAASPEKIVQQSPLSPQLLTPETCGEDSPSLKFASQPRHGAGVATGKACTRRVIRRPRSEERQRHSVSVWKDRKPLISSLIHSAFPERQVKSIKGANSNSSCTSKPDRPQGKKVVEASGSTVRKTGASIALDLSHTQETHHRQGSDAEERLNSQFLRSDAATLGPPCAKHCQGSGTNMLQEWGVVRSAGDSPPPRFPNFSKFLDGPEGLRVRSSSPHVLEVGQPLKERVSSARGCHDLVTLGSPGSSPTATASLGLSRRERSDRSPPRSYTNFSESRLVESNVRRRLGSQSGLQPAESKAMAGPSCYQRSSRAGCTRPSLGKGSRPITNSRTSAADSATGANMYDSSCDGRRGSHPRRMNLGWTWDILDVNNNLKGRKWFKNAMAVTRNNAKLSHLTLLRTPISDATASGKVREAFCGRTLKTPQGSRKDDQAGVKNPDPSGPSVFKEAPIARRFGNRIGAQSPHRVLAPAAPSVSSELQGGVSPSTCATSILRSRSDPKSSPKSSRRGRHASMDRRQWASVTGDHETSPGPSVRCVLYSKLVSEDDGSCRGSALGADTKPTKGRAKRRHCKASSVSVPAVIHVARERRVSNVSKKEVYPTRKIIPSTKPP